MTSTGSPAHAGIDPSLNSPSGRVRRFPRTRGDRPAVAVYSDKPEWVPPHTRG